MKLLTEFFATATIPNTAFTTTALIYFPLLLQQLQSHQQLQPLQQLQPHQPHQQLQPHQQR